MMFYNFADASVQAKPLPKYLQRPMGRTYLCRVLALLFLRFSVPAAISQDCSLPDEAAINTNLRSLLTSVGGEGSATVTTLLDHHFDHLPGCR